MMVVLLWIVLAVVVGWLCFGNQIERLKLLVISDGPLMLWSKRRKGVLVGYL